MPDPQLPPTSEASAFRAPSPQPPQAKDQSPAKPAADMSLRPHSIPPTQHTALAVPDSLRTTEARPRTAFFPNITWKRPADTSQTAGSRPHDNPPTQARKLLDLFAGKSAPISAAASLQSIPRWEPIDIAINAQHDILQDAFFHRLLQLAWSGSIGLLVAAPPCRDYSILKLAPGGPPPCRSPEHMDQAGRQKQYRTPRRLRRTWHRAAREPRSATELAYAVPQTAQCPVTKPAR